METFSFEIFQLRITILYSKKNTKVKIVRVFVAIHRLTCLHWRINWTRSQNLGVRIFRNFHENPQPPNHSYRFARWKDEQSNERRESTRWNRKQTTDPITREEIFVRRKIWMYLVSLTESFLVSSFPPIAHEILPPRTSIFQVHAAHRQILRNDYKRPRITSNKTSPSRVLYTYKRYAVLAERVDIERTRMFTCASPLPLHCTYIVPTTTTIASIGARTKEEATVHHSKH